MENGMDETENLPKKGLFASQNRVIWPERGEVLVGDVHESLRGDIKGRYWLVRPFEIHKFSLSSTHVFSHTSLVTAITRMEVSYQ